ncbi:hypothetical protein EV426DRAFT_713466 [Tirmania nivea]|nr:hypothetical protein EV426DRAFT_713466 [Tirmania nivea]
MSRFIKILRASRIQSRIQNPVVIQRHGLGTSSGYDEESIDTSLPDRIFRLEDNFMKVTQDIGIMKEGIGTLKWRMGVLLVAVVSFGGTATVNARSNSIGQHVGNCKKYHGSVAILKVKRKKSSSSWRDISVSKDTQSRASFKEANINDLVNTAISPIVDDVKVITGHNELRLIREREIVSTDDEMGGKEEFVVIIEAKNLCSYAC